MERQGAPVSVGLVGAGPWAEMVHAPTLAASPDTRLAGVWARRPEAAARLGAPVYERVEDLFDNCEAVAFAVPPAVQADLAFQAAKAGKALLLEKPLAADLESARRLADAIATAGVPSQMVLSWRYADATRAFLDRAAGLRPFGGHASFIANGLLGGPFATPWRLERGAILDLGPHMIDLMEAALGRVVSVQAHGDPLAWCGLLLNHETGASSEISLCMTARGDLPPVSVAVYGEEGNATFTDAPAPETFSNMVTEFAATVRRGGGHPLDAAHGLHLQELITQAESQLSP
ncbi:Gfo/Idh/MocA family protein [Bailinhaonella thermotolerans]|uniref:Gfo/Idh/MocA family oxidoreductase n=1 Tax=Bailinhaonella thermotolerans TaxID=1070861 RepID=A0A3A4A769_9ACTN|nr:Gfo/Idh/MocA family oxidoreductase [Bailinhaonella thermotolerans]RJL20795.1 gfo/Idh/MocA family oxidoreductase [Bailinhaonella thermotolerans]